MVPLPGPTRRHAHGSSASAPNTKTTTKTTRTNPPDEHRNIYMSSAAILVDVKQAFRGDLERAAAAGRRQVGEATWVEAWAEGWGLSLEQASVEAVHAAREALRLAAQVSEPAPFNLV